MAKVSYVVTVHNQEPYIESVIDSLKKSKGAFRKEYIFINEASTDNSLEAIKQHAKELPNTTIISRNYKGHSTITNEGIYLASGDYIKFVDGSEILDPEATLNLLASLSKHGHRVAFGMQGKYDHKNGMLIPSKKKAAEAVINNPLSALLKPNLGSLKTVGTSGSLVSRDLLEEISNQDNEIFTQDFSLALRCAAKSNFVFCPKTVYYSPLEGKENFASEELKLQTYNAIIAIRKFIDFAPNLANKYKKEIYGSVISLLWETNKQNYKLLPKYIASKLYIPSYNLDELKKFLDKAVKNFFKT